MISGTWRKKKHSGPRLYTLSNLRVRNPAKALLKILSDYIQFLSLNLETFVHPFSGGPPDERFCIMISLHVYACLIFLAHTCDCTL